MFISLYTWSELYIPTQNNILHSSKKLRKRLSGYFIITRCSLTVVLNKNNSLSGNSRKFVESGRDIIKLLKLK